MSSSLFVLLPYEKIKPLLLSLLNRSDIQPKENFESETEAIQIVAQINQVILISRCRDVTIQISGKANAISIENSPAVSLIIDSLVSSVDVIKSSSFALQVFGTLPTILLDQVDGATVYLAPTSLGTEVLTSKCSGINVNVPKKGNKSPKRKKNRINRDVNDEEDEDEDDDEEDEDEEEEDEEEEDEEMEDDVEDYTECPLPEQIRSFVKNGKMVSQIVDHAG